MKDMAVQQLKDMNKKNKIEREINTYSKITYSLNNVSNYNNRIDK